MTEKNKDTISNFLQKLSPDDFRALGNNDIAYIKIIKNAGQREKFILYEADGTQIGQEGSYNAAIQYAISNERRPVTVH